MRHISEELIKRSYDVTVLAGNGLLKAYEEIINGVRVRRYPTINWLRGLHFLLHNFSNPFTGLISSLYSGFTPSIYFDIIKGEYDLVHATPIPSNNVILSFFAAKKARIPFICTPFFHYKIREFYNKLWINMLKESDAVFVCTDTEKNILAKLGVNKSKMHKITLGVDIELWKSANSERFRQKFNINADPIILFAAFKSKEKGVFFLLSAMKEVWKKIPDAYLVAMGLRSPIWLKYLSSIPKKQRERILDLDLTRPSDQQLKRDAFAACDIYVMPSIADALGLVYLESWICSKPVIGADTPVMREVISNGSDGFLVKFGNTEDLARKITMLLNEDHLRREMGAQGYQKVIRNHNWKSITNNIINLYETIVK
jgi:glycosyltransferase involved in cell wall biosynthesis